MNNKLNELPNELNSVIASYLKKPTLKQRIDNAVDKYFDFVKKEFKSVLMEEYNEEQADFIISGKYSNENDTHYGLNNFNFSVVIPLVSDDDEEDMLIKMCNKTLIDTHNEKVILEEFCDYDIRVMRGVVEFIQQSEFNPNCGLEFKYLYEEQYNAFNSQMLDMTQIILNVVLGGYFYTEELKIENLLPQEADYYVGKLNVSDINIFDEYRLVSYESKTIYIWSKEEDYEEYTNHLYFSFSKNGTKYYLDITTTCDDVNYLCSEIDYEDSEVVLEELETYYYEYCDNDKKFFGEEIVVAGGGLSNGNAYAVVYFDMEKKMWRYKEYGENGFDNLLLGSAVRNIKDGGHNTFAIVKWFKSNW